MAKDYQVWPFDANLSMTVASNIVDTTFRSAQTVLGTSATAINFPEKGNNFTLYHCAAGYDVYLGEAATITAAGSDVATIPSGFEVVLRVKEGNELEIYGIISSGAITMYAIGMGAAE